MSESKFSKFNIFKHIAKFFIDCKSEVKKVVWPTPSAVFRNSWVVLASIFIVGLFVFVLDIGLYYLLGKVMNISQ
ncbi:MAG: preprotein translocase subunit SecE [Lactobacillales bacterium]|jgi:preprotein translocase subunit SecE|nr:preprotein translocase subunit SecE [Lactobacillales bacterium]MDR1253564.1 preprotein translocase subunit SecE [Oscillospiraceae bacterium]